MRDEVEIIRRVYEGFDRGDIDALLSSLHPDVEWNETEHVTFWPGSAFTGPDAIVNGLFARIPGIFGQRGRFRSNGSTTAAPPSSCKVATAAASSSRAEISRPKSSTSGTSRGTRSSGSSSTPTPGCSPEATGVAPETT